MIAANRIGKTEGVGGYELTLHLTGRYPRWWIGARFDRPISCWAAGKSNESTRDVIQAKLFGKATWKGRDKIFGGTGLVPGECIGGVTWKRGVANLADTIMVKHVTGAWSQLGLKSYEQGRGSFEGTEQDVVWLDEEPPIEVYEECSIRTMTTKGHLLLTFTPMEGMSSVVKEFLKGAGGDDIAIKMRPRCEERSQWLMQAMT